MFKNVRKKRKNKVVNKKAIRLIRKVIEPELKAILNENPDMDLLFIDFEKREEGGYFLKNGTREKKVPGKILRAVTEISAEYGIQSSIKGSYSKPSKFTFFKEISK